MRNLKLSTKFSLAIGVIVLAFCVILSILIYNQLREKVIEEANEKTLIIMAHISAVGDYVRNTLRPKMYEILPSLEYKDEFIVEAMSTTHVTQEVMKKFNNDLSEYVFKRVSDRPLNPNNKADEFHMNLISYFQENKFQRSWNGVINIHGVETLIRARVITADKSCLFCHGDPKLAPKGLLKKYGQDGVFGWKEGEIVGVESVTVPLDVALSQVKSLSIAIFTFGSVSLVFLFISLQGAFWSLVSKPLNNLSALFKGIANGTEPLNQRLVIHKNDEIGELSESFNQMIGHLDEANKTLQKNAETLHSIFQGITDPIALVNPDCTLEITNKTYRDWIAKGKSAVFFYKCDPDKCDADTMCPVCYLNRVKREKKAVSEYWEGDDGCFYYVHFYPIFDENQEVLKAVHYVKDITDRKKMDEQMRLTEKMAAIGQLSAGIAHEINNPLGGIRLCFNNLVTLNMDNETRNTHIEVINSGFERIENIVRQLLDFSKRSYLDVSPTFLNTLIDRVLNLTDYMVSKKGIRVIKHYSPDIPQIIVDCNKMEQVFLNIILNSIQAIDGSGGEITIETSCSNGYCKASFKDTGHGIPEDVLPFIFDPFFTTKGIGEGTGLGLSVSKSIVEQHNGKIQVESGKGWTSFTIILPSQR